MKMKTNNKLLLIAFILAIFGCHNVYAQEDSIYIVSHGKLLKSCIYGGDDDGKNIRDFYISFPFDTLFIHLPKIYRKNQRSDSIKYIFKDIGQRPIKSGYAYIDKDGVVRLTGLNHKNLFILKDKNGEVIHWYVVRLYFGNSSKYILLLSIK